MTSPYSALPSRAFWRKAVAEASPFDQSDLYQPKWKISPDTKVATAGSCFAQHITCHLRANNFNVLDLEQPPFSLEDEHHQRFGFSLYSCRYGNIYTAQQLLQLAQEARGRFQPQEPAWERHGRWFDAQRPGVEPEGLDSADAVREHRRHHLTRVRLMFKRMDLFIFTLGLTEAWVRRGGRQDTVYPTAPGTIAGQFEPEQYAFRNYGCASVIQALQSFRRVVLSMRRGRSFRMLLTVSPVPLTATASGGHVLAATTYSKAVLRAAAGDLAAGSEAIDYFPSYEIITNQAARGVFYEANLRSVRSQGVSVAMDTFLKAHSPEAQSHQPSSLNGQAADATPGAPMPTRVRGKSASRVRRQGQRAERQTNQRQRGGDLQCEEALLEAFGP